MAESKPERTVSSSEKDVKAPNLIERATEEIEAILHTEKSRHHHHKETHGMSDDIDESTPIDEVKGPNVFERAKEEIEALVQTILPKKEPKSHDSSSKNQEKEIKTPNLIERAMEEIEAVIHTEKSPHQHHKETHGMSSDIDENTPIGEVRGPNVFERAKEEIEALVQTIHSKKESRSHDSSSKSEGGFFTSIGSKFDKICAPQDKRRNSE